MSDLTSDQVRDWLKENVTVVSPGETLVIRTEDLTAGQIREFHDSLNQEDAEGTPWLPFRCLVVHGHELGIYRPGDRLPERTLVTDLPKDPPWLGDLQVWRMPDGTFQAVHGPTTLTAEGSAVQDVIFEMAGKLLARQQITVNDGREALGLPRWNVPGAGE